LNKISPLYSPEDLGQGANSQLAEDARRGLLTGWDGSSPGQAFQLRTSEVTLGLVYDTRDNEPAPTEGMFHEASARSGLKALGGQFDCGGVNLTARFYRTLGVRWVVAALRVLADATFGDVPFFLLSTTGGPELRVRFYRGARLELETVAALDAGRVWADLGSGDGGGPKLSTSGGLRVAWNRNFVIRLDVGFGLSEPYGTGSIYLTFDEMF
jgi:hypothetical protein